MLLELVWNINSAQLLGFVEDSVLTLCSLQAFLFPLRYIILHFEFSSTSLYIEITVIIYDMCLLNLVLCKGNNPKYE